MTSDLYSTKQLPNGGRIVVWSDEESAPLTPRSIVSALNSLRAENDQLRARLHHDEQRITAQQERIGELEAQLAEVGQLRSDAVQTWSGMVDTAARLTAQLAEARAALRPFEEWLEGIPPHWLDNEGFMGEDGAVIRRAVAVYQQLPATAGAARDGWEFIEAGVEDTAGSESE